MKSHDKRSLVARQPEDIAPREKALLCAKLALEKKALGMTVLEIGELSSIAEYFVICSGRSVRQTRAIAEHVQTRMKAKVRQIPLGVEGMQEGIWILLDYDDVIIHVFYEPTRELYSLEKLWSDAPAVRDPEIDRAQEDSPQGSEESSDWED
ncbi:MAG: ribosome silencing factor [bacterium]